MFGDSLAEAMIWKASPAPTIRLLRIWVPK